MIYNLHILTTLFMWGFITCIQLIHYPMIRFLQPESRPVFEKFHQRQISPLVVFSMGLEAFTGLWLCYVHSFKGFYLIGLTLIVLIWLSTLLLQVPMHNNIAKGVKVESSTNRLIRTNWIRTVLWTVRALVVVFYFKPLV